MSAYDLYKPLRNYVRHFPVMESLNVMRAYFQHLQFQQPMPNFIETHYTFKIGRNRNERGMFEWELDTLTKEIILNGGYEGEYHLASWAKFGKAVQMLRGLENDIYREFRHLMQPNV